MLPLMMLLACAPPEDVEPDPASSAPAVEIDIASLAVEPPPYGSTVRIARSRVITGRTADDGIVVVQDLVTGDGLAIQLGARLDGWPPAVGTEVWLRGWYLPVGGVPYLMLDEPSDWRDLDAVSEAVVAEAPEDLRTWQLVSFPDVVVTSCADPVGFADTSLGRRFRDRFGVGVPGWGSAGALTAVVLTGGPLGLRTSDDWQGEWRECPPLDVTVAEVLEGRLANGTPVRFPATQATPWSRGGRYAVLQDASGAGLWADGEGFGIDESSEEGSIGWWRGEIRGGSEPWVRTWWVPEVEADGEVVVSPAGDAEDGRIRQVLVETAEPPDAFGERAVAGGGVLDDRFVPLEDLALPAELRVAEMVRESEVRWAVLP